MYADKEFVDRLDECMDELNKDVAEIEERYNNETPYDKAKAWCKRHKPLLIFLGITVAVVGGCIILNRKNKKTIIPVNADNELLKDTLTAIADDYNQIYDPNDFRWIDGVTGEIFSANEIISKVEPDTNKATTKAIHNALNDIPEMIGEDGFTLHTPSVCEKYKDLPETDALYSIAGGMFNAPVGVCGKLSTNEAVVDAVTEATKNILANIDLNDISLIQIMTDLK